jgi:Ni/Co efflux regulator RcnB
MRRLLAIAAMFALAVPTLVMAEEQHHPGGKSAVKPAVQQHKMGPTGGPHAGPTGGPHPRAMVGPHPGGPAGRQFSYRGHMINRVHLAPFVYPNGWAYRRWAAGMVLPPLFLTSAYFYADWATLGVPEPQPGFQWVRYGPDLILVNVATGQVVDTVYGAFD